MDVRKTSRYPKGTDNLQEAEFADISGGIAETQHLDKVVDNAFVGTEEAEAERDVLNIDGVRDVLNIDGVLDDGDVAQQVDDDAAIDDEEELLEKIPLPGNPVTEQERKKKWMVLPRRARIAIRRLHRNFKHLPKLALVQMLRAAKCPKEYIDAAKSHRCNTCEQAKPKPPTHKVSMPRPYEFNHEIGIDVVEVKDITGTVYDILNIVDYGTTFEQAFIVREARTNGTPSSQSCLEAFVNGWVRPFGWPKLVAVDRGLHNRGVFGTTLAKKGIRFRPAGLESPEQIGRVERRNAVLKHLLDKVTKETNVGDRKAMEMALTESIVTINEMSRHGGFAPVQWVLSRFPRQPATLGDEQERADIGAIQAHLDGPTAFALQAEYRLQARKAFVGWDCGKRVITAWHTS